MQFDALNFVLTVLVSVAIGFLISRHFASRRKVAWTVLRRRVLDPVGGKFPSNVKVFFDDHEVEGLTEWRFGLWNSGNRAITKEEVTGGGAVTLHFKSDKVLKTTEPATSRPEILEDVSVASESDVAIRIQLLDVGDSIAFTVYTTGESKRRTRAWDALAVEGHILNLPQGLSFVRYSRQTKFDALMLLFAVVFYIVVGLWLTQSGITAASAPQGEEMFEYFQNFLSAEAARNLTMVAGGLLVILGALLFLGAFGVVIAFAMGWFNQPPAFVQQKLRPSDIQKSSRDAFTIFYRMIRE